MGLSLTDLGENMQSKCKVINIKFDILMSGTAKLLQF